MTIRFKAYRDVADIERQFFGGSPAGGLAGYIEISYAELVAVLGEPITDWNDDSKTDAEWYIQFGSGTQATIYNYKDGRNYMGLDGKDKEDIRDWHIGHGSKAALKRVSELFPEHVVSGMDRQRVS